MNDTIAKLKHAYDVFVRMISWLQSPLLLAVRVYWGWQFAQNGWGKLHNLDHVAEFFASLSLPLPHQTAIFVATVEFLGGILMTLGLFSRITGLALTIDMIMAYLTADREALMAVISDPGKFYTADPYTFLFASLLLLIFGPGKIALDTLLDRIVWSAAAKSPSG